MNQQQSQTVDLFSVIGRLQTENFILKDRIAYLEQQLNGSAPLPLQEDVSLAAPPVE